jgi:predicted nucleic acid-binding protein
VTRYLVDTNIISDIVKPKPSESLLTRMANQRDEDLFIASLTLAEIHRGILDKPNGRKRAGLGAVGRKGRRRCSQAASCRSTTRPG